MNEVRQVTYILLERPQWQTVHGPNAVSVNRLRCCWSTIQLGADHFGTREMFRAHQFLHAYLIVQLHGH